jgi:signal transduction histidine kinase/phage shock protein PspC (stress-responsive transcriptional regulator)
MAIHGLTSPGDLVTRATTQSFAGDEPLLFGAATALAARLDTEPVVVRLAFVVLGVAGGAGIPIYGVTWLTLVWRRPPPTRPVPSLRAQPRRTLAVALMVAGLLLVLSSRFPGVADQLVWPAAVVALGLAFMWPRPDTEVDPARALARAGALRILGGLTLVAGGLGSLLAANLSYQTVRDGLAAAAFVIAGTLLLFAPFFIRLVQSLNDERRERIRADERARVAAHLHDSVLQTLTLIQKRASDPMAMSSLARRQERELRRWLYGGAPVDELDGFRSALDGVVAEIEDLHLVAVEQVMVGDAPLDPALTELVAATREALTNAAKFAGTPTLSLYAEVGPESTQVFVRDRGAGFVLDDVPDDRHGIADSVIGRVARVGGTTDIRTAPGQGTEVRLSVPRSRA